MAARRLLIVMVLLLAVATAAAALAPRVEEESRSESERAAAEADRNDPGWSGPREGSRLIELRLTDRGDPVEVDVEVGDRVVLHVRTEPPETIEIEALGLVGTPSRTAPTRFDFVIRRPGDIVVRTQGDENPIATLSVAQSTDRAGDDSPQGEPDDLPRDPPRATDSVPS